MPQVTLPTVDNIDTKAEFGYEEFEYWEELEQENLQEKSLLPWIGNQQPLEPFSVRS